MMDFRLSGLTPSLLEKVITKLDEKSYFHLQQTCHDMYDFVRRSQNISVHMEGKIFLRFRNGWSKKELLCEYRPANADKSDRSDVDLVDLYGIRLGILQIDKEAEDFDRICALLKKQRLTCVLLDFMEFSLLSVEEFIASGQRYGIQSEWTDEQVLTLLEIVMPREVHLERNFEPLFQSKSIESVEINTGLNESLKLFPRLLQAFPDVYISTAIRGDQFILIRTVMKYLELNPLPHLRRFVFKIDGGTGRSETEFEDMEIELSDYNLTKVLDDGFDWLSVDVEMPEHFILEVCQITLHTDCDASIYCGKRGEGMWQKIERDTQEDGDAKDKILKLFGEEESDEDDDI